ncbi:YifB family Mg chelatase-like AAA ATPase [Eubacteriales bacterium KG127]
MFNLIKTGTLQGLKGEIINIETDISNGIPYFKIVGMVDTTIKEARERVRGAIINSNFKFPNRKITVNFSPADIHKRGTHFDLPLAISILCASGQVQITKYFSHQTAFLGELSLDGKIKSVKGVLPLITALKSNGITKFFLPKRNTTEASLIKDIEIYSEENLRHVVEVLIGKRKRNNIFNTKQIGNLDSGLNDEALDFAEIKGHETVKRAIIVAAAGGHGVLLVGSPSCGKTMISKRLTSILPPMEYEEMVEATMIHSIAGNLSDELPFINKRPFRNPHYSISRSGLIGGGNVPVPGELSLATKGVLFLDEIGELRRETIEALRTPLEEKKVTIVRRGMAIDYPADFLFVAATNPCRCGYYGDPYRSCTCTPREVNLYLKKISGAIRERIDMQINLKPINYNEFTQKTGMTSRDMRKFVINARIIQKERFSDEKIKLNSSMDERMINKFCKTDHDGDVLLENAFNKHLITPRTHQIVLKIARTIADMDGSENLCASHIAEALRYRGNIDEYN